MKTRKEESFNVYDDGGNIGPVYTTKYSKDANGALILTAPENYVLQVSGTKYLYHGDKFTIYGSIACVHGQSA